MSDRLTDLQRQRALLQEHLAWLDREIARESGSAADQPASPNADHGFHAPQAGFGAAARPAVMPSAADILASYSQEKPGNMAKDAKRGCLLYFVFAMGALFLCAMGAYLLYVNTHRAP